MIVVPGPVALAELWLPLLRLATMPKAHDRAQLKSTVTGPMLKAHISAQLNSTSKLIASCTDVLGQGCHASDAKGS